MRVAVIGGGVSGIAAAHALAMAGTRVTIVEAGSRLGGVLRTVRRDGFVIEEGPDSILAAKPAAAELCAALGIAHRLHGTTPGVRGACVMRRGRLVRLPEGLSQMVPTRLGPMIRAGLLSPAGLMRAAMEPFIPARRDEGDESVAAFITRRFGRELFERLVEPLLAGIHAGDAARLSILSTFPALRARERAHGSLLRAPRTPGISGSAFLSLPSGLAEIPEAAERLFAADPSVTLRLDARAVRITLAGSPGVALASGEIIPADALVVATPAHEAARLLGDADPALASALAAIEHASVAVISLGLPSPAVARPLDATGYVVPRIEQRAVLACTWSSAKWPGRAPAGHELFRVFVGGAGRAEIVDRDDAALVALARAELEHVLGASGEPVVSLVSRWRRATPQYTLGHAGRVARVNAHVARHPVLALAGNALDGVGISDCVRTGIDAARRVLGAGLKPEHQETG